jgi:hypothetical protein
MTIATTGPRSTDALIGELGHELAVLVRSDVELAAVRRAPELRRLAAELGVAIAAGVALLLGLAATSWSAVRALDVVVPSWSAPLLVGAAWILIAGVLLRLDHPRRLGRRLAQEELAAAVDAARGERAEAEDALRVTAERLAGALAREAAARELASDAAAVGRDAEVLLHELLTVLTAPGRACIDFVDRLAARG